MSVRPPRQIQGFKYVIEEKDVTHGNGIDLLSQENQDYYNHHDQQLITCKYDGDQGYYNQSDQQFITRKYNGDLEQVNTELVPAIVLEEK